MATYTGSDVRVIIELANPGAGAPRFSKQLMEVTTLTVSCHRVKTPAVACGYINPKGFARGRRTIAGTMVLTKFTTEVLMRFLQAGYTRSCRPVAQQQLARTRGHRPGLNPHFSAISRNANRA